MVELVKINCPSCGGELNITKGVDDIFCNYCGTKFALPKNIQQSPKIQNYLQLAKAADEASNQQESINYYNKVLELDPDNFQAWIGKGFSTFFTTTLLSPKLREMTSCFKKAYDSAPIEEKNNVAIEIKSNTLVATKVFFNNADSHYQHFAGLYTDMGSISNNRDEYVGWLLEIFTTIDEIVAIPENHELLNRRLLEYGIEVLKNNHGVFNSTFQSGKLRGYQSKIVEIDPTYQISTQPTNPDCFIATATMGDYDHPYVLSLRLFRDKKLLKNSIGAIFVDYYYRTSPFFANIISKSNILRRISLYILIRPLTKIANWYLR